MGRWWRIHERDDRGGWGMLGWARRAWIALFAASACAIFGFSPHGSARSLQAVAERPVATGPDAVSGAQISGQKIAMEPGDAVPDGAPHAAAPVARWPRGEAGSSPPRRLQDTRVTVLLWMAPGSYGIRRGHPTADPILCLPDGCYVSRGPELSARFSRADALWASPTPGAVAPGPAATNSPACSAISISEACPAICSPLICTS